MVARLLPPAGDVSPPAMSISVVTPYSSQCALLRLSLDERVEVNTVDSYQVRPLPLAHFFPRAVPPARWLVVSCG